MIFLMVIIQFFSKDSFKNYAFFWVSEQKIKQKVPVKIALVRS